jgi:hypothetical protein
MRAPSIKQRNAIVVRWSPDSPGHCPLQNCFGAPIHSIVSCECSDIVDFLLPLLDRGHLASPIARDIETEIAAEIKTYLATLCRFTYFHLFTRL